MKKSALLFLFLAACLAGAACTTFLLADMGNYYFGRNYDWITGNGMVMTNPRGMVKTSATTGSNISWTSAYGSITFNQYGKEFPTGGMNEKGLVVELMWLDETRYPQEDSRAAFNVLQWIQYQLDNCSTIEEVIATDQKIRISAKGTPLHYLIADASGKAATIEFLEGKMVVHKGTDLKYPVLTNSVYAESLEKTKPVADVKKEQSTGNNSLDRFARACGMIKGFDQRKDGNGLDYSFSILNTVAQGNYTKWSIVYDITGKKIHFITDAARQRRTVSFSSLDLSCGKGPLAIDINTQAAGELSSSMKPLSFEGNRQLVESSVRQSRSRIEIPDADVKESVDFFYDSKCQQKDK